MSELVRSPKQLGFAFRNARRAQALTQTDAANRACIRQGTLSQLENGLETTKLKTIMNLLRALDLELTVQPRSKGSHKDIEDMFRCNESSVAEG